MTLLLCLAALMAQPASTTAAPVILVEAESFANLGGWGIDQQSMDQMGSPYLLAHGLGTPVADAKTSVEFPRPGRYRLFVRTRDWVAPWKASPPPGRFQVSVAGKRLETVFGTEGAEWHWQAGPTVEITGGRVEVAIHDLAGFDGRCDALLFAADPNFVPPNDGQALAQFRRQASHRPESPDDAGEFDLVVVGGGIAGTCTAISAARLGVRVALVHDRPMLGGNNSSEVRVGLSGKVHQEPYPRLGDLVDEIAPIGYYDFTEAKRHPDRPESKRILAMDPIKATHNAGPASNYEDEKKLAVVRAEKNLRLFLNTHVDAAEKKGDRIVAVTGRDIRTGRESRFRARWFADCTGDGTLGFLAKADFRVGRESRADTAESRAPDEADRLVMGTSVQWYAEKQPESAPFPDCPWAMAFTDENCQPVTRGDWDWETGMNLDQVAEIERVRDHALRVTFGNWSFLKNHSRNRAKYANEKLAWVAYIGGKRESRRILGDVILCQQDVEGRRDFPDACVTTTWTIDLHVPSPANSKQFPGQEFRSIAQHTKIQPYPIPYRCLYSRNVSNLFMAGRNISVTHVALGTIRVQKTTGMMGEVVGMAASLCRKHDTDPRGVYQQYVSELQDLMRRGVGKKAVTQ